MRNKFVPILALLLAIPSISFSQGGDVCCIMGKKSGDGVETSATTLSAGECKAGNEGSGSGTTEGFKVCSSAPDPSNLCANTSAESRCKSCGYHWNGETCLAEDPVKKAKEQLKAEQKKEKEGATKKPSSTAEPTEPAVEK